jgi:hypothetical protein
MVGWMIDDLRRCGLRACVVGVIGVACGGGCATPSRRLPERVVDDPVTLPRQMIEVGLAGRREVTERPEWEDAGEVIPSIRYGLTDRLMLLGITGLEYALLDDAPPEHASTGRAAVEAPLSLSVRGEFQEIGWSTYDGFLASPMVGVSAGKRLGSRVRFWTGGAGGTRFRGGAPGPGLDGWWLGSNAAVLVQVLPKLAVDLDLHAGWGFDNWQTPVRHPSGLTSYWFGARPGLAYRPFHWLTAGMSVELQLERHRPPTIEPMPDGPLPPPGGWDWSPPPAVRPAAFARLTW